MVNKYTGDVNLARPSVQMIIQDQVPSGSRRNKKAQKKGINNGNQNQQRKMLTKLGRGHPNSATQGGLVLRSPVRNKGHTEKLCTLLSSLGRPPNPNPLNWLFPITTQGLARQAAFGVPP